MSGTEAEGAEGGRLSVAVRLRPEVSRSGNAYLAGVDAAGRRVLVLERRRPDSDGTTHVICLEPRREPRL